METSCNFIQPTYDQSLLAKAQRLLHLIPFFFFLASSIVENLSDLVSPPFDTVHEAIKRNDKTQPKLCHKLCCKIFSLEMGK